MVFLSLALPAKVNRWTNILVAAFYILVGINNIIGESWVFYIVGNIVEIVILSLIIRHAWKWPTQET